MLKFAEKKSEDTSKKTNLSKWKILIVDDEREVHTITESVLSKFEFHEKGIEFLHAYSGEEAVKVVEKNPDIALILLDVVMESDDAGLKSVKLIREKLKNKTVRIILRTGQPGQAPEKDVIRDYDINDYKNKTELTSSKLYTTVISALRNYNDIKTIEQNRIGLTKIIDATRSLFNEKSLVLFAEGILTQIVSILDIAIKSDEGHEAYFAILENGEYKFLASLGENPVITDMATHLMYEAYESKSSFFKDDAYVGFYQSANDKMILLYLKGCENLNDLDKNLLELFSNNISIAFDNLCLNDEMVSTQSDIVKKLGEVIESRSKETANHVERVANVSYILAKAYGLSEEEATKIKLASPMHDIGKVAISDEILLKPGKLTKEEFEKMKEHSMIGWEILKDSDREILKTAAYIARDHHEKWDGSGYPSGLKGEEITIEGRITAVADVFDALSHKRVYKDAWPLDKVFNLFREERGKHFEPKLVDLFFENLDKIAPEYVKKVDVEVGGNEYIKNLKLTSTSLNETNLKKLLFEDSDTRLVLGFISPHLDFKKVSTKIKEFFGENIKLILSSSAGELANIDLSKNSSIYLEADDSWDSIVLQSFSSSLIKNIEIHTVNLHNEDIIEKNITKTPSQRVEEIEKEIEALDIKSDIDFKKDFALTFIDGVSNSESFFMEAMYKSRKFPCNIVGGSAGGKFDFKETFLFDGESILQHSAVVAIVRMQEGKRFGLFKTQNFKKTRHSFTVVDADPALRYVKSVKRKGREDSENIIDFFCSIFKCKPEELEQRFSYFAFGLEIDSELYIRSISSVDLENRLVYFYTDIDFGDELFLCSITNIVKQTRKDFSLFMKNKPSSPIGGILNDCILRRVSSPDELDKIKTFDNIPFIGFSTFGEFMGINVNQTLTSLFFFDVENEEDFRDYYIDNFVLLYATYQSFFRERELKQLKSNELKNSYNELAKLNEKLEDKIVKIRKSEAKLVESEKMASLGGMVAGIAHEINTPVGMALTGITHLFEEGENLEKLFVSERLSEEEFKSYLETNKTLNQSIQNNLTKAAELVKSFKQVAVDQSSDEIREFNLKEYMEEILLSLHNEIKKTKHKVILDIDSSIRLNSNPGVFSQIFTNFIVNSFFHGFENKEEGEIKITASVNDKNLKIVYQDNGKGLNHEQKQKIFEPFFTTKRGKGGSGLGMNIVYNLVNSKLDGSLEVESEEGRWIKFILKFPSKIIS